MAFIKTHLISLLSGFAAAGFIVVAVLGMTSDSVVTGMRQRANIASEIRALRSDPKNQECIEAEELRGQRFAEEYQETRALAEQINARPFLLEGVFPVPERLAVAYDFRERYKEAVRKLPYGKLVGGNLPGDAEVAEAAEDIAALQERLAQERDEGGAMAPAVVIKPTPTPGTSTSGTMIAGMGAGPQIAGRGARPAGARPTYAGAAGGDPRVDPHARAAITKARRIRCYVEPEPDAALPTFHVSPIWDPSVQPQPHDMWYAQVGLWVQQDMVDAVAELNDEAARRLAPAAANVENMPVKRLQSIRVLGYWTKTGAVSFPIYGRSTTAVPTPEAAFTDRTSDDQFDVIRFRVTAVVDQREILSLVDAITRQNFYQEIGARYEAIESSDADYSQGYLYGDAPVVRLTLDFEGYLARYVYEEYFPAEVRVALGIADKKGKGGKP